MALSVADALRAFLASNAFLLNMVDVTAAPLRSPRPLRAQNTSRHMWRLYVRPKPNVAENDGWSTGHIDVLNFCKYVAEMKINV